MSDDNDRRSQVAAGIHGCWNDESVCRLKTSYQEKNIVGRIRRNIRHRNSYRMLEFGPGLGCLLNLVTERWADVEYHVADVDAAVLGDLSEKHSRLIGHQVAGIEDLESIDGCFDIIVAVDVWEHLPLHLAMDYTQWCWRHLSPGGMLILQTPNWGCPVTPSTFYSDLTHCTQFNEISMAQLLRGAGIPATAFLISSRRTPGCLGSIRDLLNDIFGLLYQCWFIFFGAVRLSVFSADLIVEAHKPRNE